MTANRRITSTRFRAALMLLAMLALVVARSVTATAGLALPTLAGHGPEHCAGSVSVADHGGHEHGSGHASAPVGEHDAGSVAHAHGLAHDGACQSDRGPVHHHDPLPCCVHGAALVLPAIGDGLQRRSTCGIRLAPDRAEVLKSRLPEGPNEPPRTTDMV